MLIRQRPGVRSSEITDEQLYLRRRDFIRLASGAAIAAASPIVSACGNSTLAAGSVGALQAELSGIKPNVVTTDEKKNSFADITSYNNFFEFGTGKTTRRATPDG